jgi:diamine N-acetyltransferase
MQSLIRTATPADAGALAALGVRTFQETFGDQYRAPDLDVFLAGAYGEALQRRELEDPSWLTLLAEREGEPVGFAQLVVGRCLPDHPLPAPVELNRIYILKAEHGTGLGDALMGAAVAAAVAAGGRALWLGVWEHNLRAQAFYRRWGFTQAGSHTFMVGTQADTDHILVRTLPAGP